MSTPKMKTPGRGCGAGAGNNSRSATCNPQPKGGRPEYQGNLNGRNWKQRAPKWKEPTELGAASLLVRLMRRWPR